MQHRMRGARRSRALVRLAALALVALPASTLRAQTDGTCIPVAERAGRELGCFITAREELGRLAASPALYWHLDTFPSRAAALAARDSARGGRATVVESLGRVWLFTIAPAEWRARGGKHVARIGPLPLFAADSFAAVYMEGVFAPGMRTVVHRHPGTEAWFTLEGAMCLETPNGKLEQRAGDAGVLVPGGLPMELTGTGTGARRSVVLILQDATKPRSTPAHDWTPRGLCQPGGGHGHGVTRDSAGQSWTLRSGPVAYRLVTRDARVRLDYFGPAERESDTTRVMPSYPRVAAPELVGSVNGQAVDTGTFRLTAQHVVHTAPGVEALRLTLRHATLPLEVVETFTPWGETGVVTRELTLTNRGRAAIAADVVPAWLLPGGAYTLRYLYGTWGQERQLAAEPLGAGIRAFEQTHGRSSKGYVPWASLRNERAGVEYLAELAWSGNWGLRVERTPGENDIELPSRPVAMRMGIRNDGGGPLRLAPGASFATPRLALTASSGDLDDAANQMHRYQRTYLSPPAPGNRPLLVQFNTWYPYGQDIDVEKAKQAADAAATFGAEAYVIDSGWYVDKDWVLELGDWQVSRRKFPRGLEELADHVRSRGMKFGMWVEIESLGQLSQNFREHPDWCLPYGGRPIINDRRCHLDFAKPAVRQWARATVERLVSTYRLGWIKIDYNIDAGDRFDASRPERAGARLHDHVVAYYQWLDELRAAHPELVVENCSSGALRFDSGIIAHTHTTWVSDIVHAKPSLQLGYGCTLQFSPEQCNHWMVGEKDDGTVDTNGAPGWWDFMFRVPMTGQFGISSRVVEWSPALRERAAANVALYKRIRGTITRADVYHLTPMPDHNRPTGWMALQYVAAEGRSVLLAYRLANGAAAEAFRLRGLQPGVRYEVTRDGERVQTATGAELATAGLRVALDEEWRAAVIELTPAR